MIIIRFYGLYLLFCMHILLCTHFIYFTINIWPRAILLQTGVYYKIYVAVKQGNVWSLTNYNFFSNYFFLSLSLSQFNIICSRGLHIYYIQHHFHWLTILIQAIVIYGKFYYYIYDLANKCNCIKNSRYTLVSIKLICCCVCFGTIIDLKFLSSKMAWTSSKYC